MLKSKNLLFLIIILILSISGCNSPSEKSSSKDLATSSDSNSVMKERNIPTSIQINWINAGMIVRYDYSDFSDAGPSPKFNATRSFNNTGTSGNVEFTASIAGNGKSYSVKSKSFHVEKGKNYTLTVTGRQYGCPIGSTTGETYIGRGDYTLKVKSSSVSDSDISFRGLCYTPDIYSINIAENDNVILDDYNKATLSLISINPSPNSSVSIGSNITAIINYTISDSVEDILGFSATMNIIKPKKKGTYSDATISVQLDSKKLVERFGSITLKGTIDPYIDYDLDNIDPGDPFEMEISINQIIGGINIQNSPLKIIKWTYYLAGKKPIEIYFQKSGVDPQIVTIPVGSDVKFMSKDSPHQISRKNAASYAPYSSIGYISPSTPTKIRFDQAGEYDFACDWHPELQVKIIVTK